MVDLQRHFSNAVNHYAPTMATVAFVAASLNFDIALLAGGAVTTGILYVMEGHFSADAMAVKNATITEPTRRVQEIFNRLQQIAKVQASFHICEDGPLARNATAFTRKVWIGRKFMERLDERETAFILGHELAHIRLRHNAHGGVAHNMNILSHALFWASGLYYGVSLAARQIGIDLPVIRPDVNMAIIANTAYQGLAFNIGSHAREYEADKGGLYYADDIEAARSFFKKLEKSKRPRWDLFSTHPHPRKRMAALEKWAADNPYITPSAPVVAR